MRHGDLHTAPAEACGEPAGKKERASVSPPQAAHGDSPQDAAPKEATHLTNARPAVTAGHRNEPTEFFFARVPPTLTQEQLLEVFSKYGAVEHHNLFKPFAEAKTSKGCGIVRFRSSIAAASARAELHDKHKWSPDYPPMVLERVNDKKKRSNISSDGTGELTFTPKFLTKPDTGSDYDAADAQQQQQQLPCASRGGSSASLQRHASQTASCTSGGGEGPARYLSLSSRGSSASSGPGREPACMPASGLMAQYAVDVIHSSGCNALHSGSHALHSGSMPQAGANALAAATAPPPPPAQRNSAPPRQQEQPWRVSFERQHPYAARSGQQLAQEQPRRVSFEQQKPHTANGQGAAWGSMAGQQLTQQAWLQQWQAANGGGHALLPGTNEGCAGPAGGTYLPTFRPLHNGGGPAGSALAAAAAFAAMQANNRRLAGLGGEQQGQLGAGAPLNGLQGIPACSTALLPYGPPLQDVSALGGGHQLGPAMFDGLTMLPGADSFMGAAAYAPMGGAPFGATSECFSTYSNFMDGHPSMQLAHGVGNSAGGFLAGGGLPSTSNALSGAAAADCSASLLASGAFASGSHVGYLLPPQPQLQQQPQQQQVAQPPQAPLQSGGNLQLTSGALYLAAGGGGCNSTDHQAEIQKLHVMQLDDGGYFDLYRSGSSLDSLKGDDFTANSSCSFPNKLSSCSSTDTRLTGSASAAAVAALARQQQEQLLTMQEQRKLQLAGQRAADGLQWQAQQQPQQSGLGSLFSAGAGQVNSGSLLQASEAGSCGGGGGGGGGGSPGDVVTLELSTTAEAVGMVAPHMDSIRAMSNAAMMIVPSSTGQLSFKLFGTPSQVQMAASMMQLLLQKEQQVQMQVQCGA